MAQLALTVLPEPRLLDWNSWRDTFLGFNPQLVNQVERDGEFKPFVDRLTLLIPTVPRHDFFDDWRSWVWATKEVLGV